MRGSLYKEHLESKEVNIGYFKLMLLRKNQRELGIDTLVEYNSNLLLSDSIVSQTS